MSKKHSHYKKDVSHLKFIDVYRIIDLYKVPAGPLDHALKKILCAGERGAKDIEKDIQEAIDSLLRWQEMRREDAGQADDGVIEQLPSDSDGWIEWNGGVCPVSHDLLIDYKIGTGYEGRGLAGHLSFDFIPECPGSNIIAYKIHKE